MKLPLLILLPLLLAAHPANSDASESAHGRKSATEHSASSNQDTPRAEGQEPAEKDNGSDPAAAQRRKLRELLTPADCPHGVVYVLDTSGSMIDRISSVKSVLESAIKDLAPDTPFNVFQFNEKFTAASAGMLRNNEAGRAKFQKWLDDVGTTGTDAALEDALLKAMSRKPSVVVLLTDAPLNKERFDNVGTICRRNRVKLNIVFVGGIQANFDEPQMKSAVEGWERVAQATSGTFIGIGLDRLAKVDKQ